LSDFENFRGQVLDGIFYYMAHLTPKIFEFVNGVKRVCYLENHLGKTQKGAGVGGRGIFGKGKRKGKKIKKNAHTTAPKGAFFLFVCVRWYIANRILIADACRISSTSRSNTSSWSVSSHE